MGLTYVWVKIANPAKPGKVARVRLETMGLISNPYAILSIQYS